jgi:hypothetical protein
MKVTALLLLASVAVPTSLDAPLQNVGFSSDEIANATSGPVVREVTANSDPRQLAVAGIVHVDATPGQIAAQLRRGHGLVNHAALQQSGTFSDPAVAADVASFRLPEGDLELLRDCKPGSCKFKLGQLGFETFGAIDWSAADAGERASAAARERMVEYVTAYRAKGNAALITYTDKKKPMSLATGVRSLFVDAKYVTKHLAALDRHLELFPEDVAPGAEDHLHWSVADYGYRPVTDLVHSVIYEPTTQNGQGPRVVIAQKHLFTSHYFLARVEFIGLFADETGEGPSGTYLVYVDRSLFDDDLGGFKRSLLVRGVLKDVRERLAALRESFAGQG